MYYIFQYIYICWNWNARGFRHNALLIFRYLYMWTSVSDVKVSFDYKPYVKDLYSCTLKRLKAADIDQEVKERAISCM